MLTGAREDDLALTDAADTMDDDREILPVQRVPTVAVASWRTRRRTSQGSERGRRLLAAVGILGFVAASAITVALAGLPISDDTVFLWVLGGMFALSLSDVGRWGRGVLVDWLPLGVLLYFYDSSHGVAQLLGSPTHQALQLGFDRHLLGTPLVAVPLQHWLHQGGATQVWEYPLFVVYLSHFFAAFVVLGLLWRFAYPRFREFRAQIVVLYGLGFVTYVLYPAAPPWMVAHANGVPMHRLVVQMWDRIGPSVASTLFEQGNTFYNQVAAVPSLHAATTMLILLFFWPRAGSWLRAVMVAYVLAMAFILVDGGEHFIFDIVVGWGYAVAVNVGFRLASAAQRSRGASPSVGRRLVQALPVSALTRRSRATLPAVDRQPEPVLSAAPTLAPCAEADSGC